MAKSKTYFICKACGAEYGKWLGKCVACEEWNTIVETEKVAVKKKPDAGLHSITLDSVDEMALQRLDTGIHELNIVCGGGIVPGSVLLIGGEPGIGKSTLALQIAGSIDALYVSGEESPGQLRQRAERLKVNLATIKVATCTEVEDIIALAKKEQPGCLIVDSIQTLYSSDIPGISGSVSQVREAATKLLQFAKTSNVPVILIGHITKEGSIAGPKLLEHLVDTVLYFEGDFSRDFRMLRAFKNRFGSINEIGLFRMTATGLLEVRDKNKVFLNPFATEAPGNAVSAALEGSRTILFEVQALVSFTHFANPRRMADGIDLNRLILITAVLEKHAGLKLSSYDVFANVSGGFHINETAADLAIAVAIASSLKEKPVAKGMGFLGEISLAGELRPVSQGERRVKEFKHSGFNTILLPAGEVQEAKKTGFQGEIVGVRTVQEALDYVF